MDRKQQNRLDMFNTVHRYLITNQALWQNVPAMQVAVEDLAASIEVINGLTGKQSTNLTGVTDDKEQARTAYEDLIFELAEQVGALAAVTENVALAAQVDITRTGLDKLTDDDLIRLGNTVAQLTGENLTNLADYLVTQDDLDELSTLKSRFSAAKGAPRVAIVGRAAQTQTLPVALNTVTRLLNQRLDRLMSRFRRKNPEFYTGYETARVIIDRRAASSTTQKTAQNAAQNTATNATT